VALASGIFSSSPKAPKGRCDDAAQYKMITENHGLCWIHEARHYKKLDPIIPQNIESLNKFQSENCRPFGALGEMV